MFQNFPKIQHTGTTHYAQDRSTNYQTLLSLSLSLSHTHTPYLGHMASHTIIHSDPRSQSIINATAYPLDTMMPTRTSTMSNTVHTFRTIFEAKFFLLPAALVAIRNDSKIANIAEYEELHITQFKRAAAVYG